MAVGDADLDCVAVDEDAVLTVGEPVALGDTVTAPVFDSADEMVCVVVCEEVMADVELAELEMDREPEYDADRVPLSVLTAVALALDVCVLVGLALGAS